MTGHLECSEQFRRDLAASTDKAWLRRQLGLPIEPPPKPKTCKPFAAVVGLIFAMAGMTLYFIVASI